MDKTLCLYFALLQGVLTTKVHLKGPTSAIRHQTVLLNCTSETPPIAKYAEILIDGGPVTSIWRAGSQCHAGNICALHNCQCSSEGLWFSLKYTIDIRNAKAVFTCVMSFHDTGRQTDELFVEVLDPPTLMIQDRVSCNSTFQVSISCESAYIFSTLEFISWVHTFQGFVVRELKGHIKNNSTMVTIESCSYQDAGEYTCSARGYFNDELIWVNKTAVVDVVGPPLILESHTEQSVITIFSTKFYSPTNSTDIQWYYLNELIINSTDSVYSVTQISVTIPMYMKRVYYNGYMTTLVLRNPRPGRYSVLLTNMYGKAMNAFVVKVSLGSSFNLRMLLLILTGITVFIVTVSMTTLVVKRRYGIHTVQELPAIYHAAPQREHDISVYDITGNHYDEINDIQPAATYLEVIDDYEEYKSDRDTPEARPHYEEIN